MANFFPMIKTPQFTHEYRFGFPVPARDGIAEFLMFPESAASDRQNIPDEIFLPRESFASGTLVKLYRFASVRFAIRQNKRLNGLLPSGSVFF